MSVQWHRILSMSFSKRLVALRKQQNMTQSQMATAVDIHVSQIKRYEAGETQPSLDVLRRIALALHISADVLLFDEDERGPDDELKLMFEAISQFGPEDKKVVSKILQGLIIQDQTQRWNAAS